MGRYASEIKELQDSLAAAFAANAISDAPVAVFRASLRNKLVALRFPMADASTIAMVMQVSLPLDIEPDDIDSLAATFADAVSKVCLAYSSNGIYPHQFLREIFSEFRIKFS